MSDEEPLYCRRCGCEDWHGCGGCDSEFEEMPDVYCEICGVPEPCERCIDAHADLQIQLVVYEIMGLDAKLLLGIGSF